jgi:hypothetical protein
VDAVGSVLKIACRRAIGEGELLHNADDCVNYLNAKFGASVDPLYLVTELKGELLSAQRAQCSRKKFPTIAGSAKFQVMVFSPNSGEILTAPRLCTCKDCLEGNYENCPSFTRHLLQVDQLVHRATRSDQGDLGTTNEAQNEAESPGQELPDDLLIEDTICAIHAGNRNSSDNFYLVRIARIFVTDRDECDQFGHVVTAGTEGIEVNYLEKKDTNPMKGDTYYLTKSKVYLFREDLVFPAVAVSKRGKNFFLSNAVKTDINYYMESQGFCTVPE